MSTRLRPLTLSLCLSRTVCLSVSHTYTHTHTQMHRAAAVEQLVALLTHSAPEVGGGGGGGEHERERKTKWGEDEHVIGRRVYVSGDN